MACCISKLSRSALALGLLIGFAILTTACGTTASYRDANAKSWLEICSDPELPVDSIKLGGTCGQRMEALSAEAACRAGNSTGCALGAIRWRTERDTFGDLDKAIELGEVGCDKGDAASCTALDLARTYGDYDDFWRGTRDQKKRCSEENSLSCYIVGNNLPERITGERREKMEAAFFRRSCQHDHPVGCRRVADAYAEGSGVTRDRERADKLYAKACRLHDPEACEKIAQKISPDARKWYDATFLISHTDIANMYEAACQSGFRHSCTRLGRLLMADRLSPQGVDAVDAARDAYAAGCEAGAPESCHFLSDHYAHGKGSLEADLERAVKIAQKGCEGGFGPSCRLARIFRARVLDLSGAEGFASRCEDGDADACFVAGRAFSYEKNFEPDRSRALTLFEKGCEHGSFEACDDAAKLHKEDEAFEQANMHWERGCELGAADACHEVGYSLRHARGIERDPERAVAFELRACKRGAEEGCGGAAIHLRAGEGIAQDRERARALAFHGCNASSLWACNNYGQMLRDGEGGDRDFDQARRFFSWACEQGSQVGCALGADIGNVQIVDDAGLEPAAFAHLFERACKVGEGSSCRTLGDIYKSEDYPQHSLQEALKSFERGCRLEHPPSCERAIRLLAKDESLERHPGHKILLRQRSCELGDPRQCRIASKDFRLGRGVEVDAKQARKFFDAAIAAGAEACHAGNLRECRFTAHYIAHGLGTDTDFPGARQFLEDACSDDVLVACHQIARERRVGDLFPREPKRALETFEALCEEGDKLACFEVASTLWSGAVEFDYERSTEIYERLCEEHDNLAACANVGFAYAHIDRDLQKTLERFDMTCRTERRYACPPFMNALMTFEPEALGERDLVAIATDECDDGSKYYCLAAARLYHNGFQVDVDLTKARQLYAKACDEQFAPACAFLNVLDMMQEPKNDEEPLEEACETGESRACLRVAARHEFSSTEPGRRARAGEYYRQACEAGEADGCILLRWAGQDSQGTLIGRDNRALVTQACKVGTARHCYYAGESLRRYDWQLSIEQFRIACERGEDRACRHLQSNGYEIPEASTLDAE